MAELLRRIQSRKLFGFYSVVIISFIGAIILNWATARGIGVSDDSILYFSAAKNFLAGHGLSRLNGANEYVFMNHFPPLYPLMLVSGNLISALDWAQLARIYNLILFGGNIFFAGLLAQRLTKRWLAGFLASVGIALTPVMVLVHLDAMTEPIFITFMLLAVGALFQYFYHPIIKWCIVTAIAAGCMALSRYAGQGILAGLAVSLFLFSKLPVRHRLLHTLVFCTISAAPLVAWMLRNYFLTGFMNNRVFSYHPPDRLKFDSGVRTLVHWLSQTVNPQNEMSYFCAIVLIVVIIGSIWLWRVHKEGNWSNPAVKTTMTLILSGFAYLVSLVVSLTFFDASTPLNDRILSPMFVILLLSLVTIIFQGLRLNDHLYFRLGISILFLFWAVWNAQYSGQLLENFRNKGTLYDSPTWQNSSIIPLLNNIPSNVIVYSNESVYLTFILDRPVKQLPERFDPVKNTERPEYSEGVKQMRESFQNPGSLMVIFRYRYYAELFAPIEEASPRLSTCLETIEGFVYTSGGYDYPFCK